MPSQKRWKHPQQAASAAATAAQQQARAAAAQVYICNCVRYAAASCKISVHHRKVPGCQTANGIHVTKSETAEVRTTHSRAAAATSAALCTHMKLISRLLRRHLNHCTHPHLSLQSHTIPTHTGTNTIKETSPKQETYTLSYWTRTTDMLRHRDTNLPVHVLRFLHENSSECYASKRTKIRLETNYQSTVPW